MVIHFYGILCESIIYFLFLGKATTPKLERYQRASRKLKLKPTSLFNNVPTCVVDTVDSQIMNNEDPIIIDNSDNQHINNIETGTSCNTDLKMSDIKELE